jgi:hypothetical protein
MGIGFRGILEFLELLKRGLHLLRLRSALALLNLIKPIVVKLGSQEQKEEFDAEWETHNQEMGEKWKSVHRQALFANVGLALSQWAGLEDTLVAIASMLLRTHEANKVGIVMYSIVNFNVWRSIIGELFSQEPLYRPLKTKWNKISERLRELKDTRDRLAHHTIYYGDRATTITGDTSLRPSRFDIRQKSQKYQPLDYDQISKFIDSVSKAVEDLTALLNAMTALLTHETSQQKSSESTAGQPHP